MKNKLNWLIMAWFAMSSSSSTYAQELFTYTEPASNMAARSIGLRMNNTFMVDESSKNINWHVLPELMFGLTRNWMVHVEGFLSNRNGRFTAEGGSLYAKYRLFSVDDVHAHTRVALYGLYAKNNSDVHQDAIDLRGHNSGSELGAVFTQLIHKVAMSGSVAWIRGADNRPKDGYKLPSIHRDAVAYTASIGKLMLPKEYISYDQVNLNLMVEALGQTNLHSGKSFVDLAPVVQLIIQSRMRVDLGYRFPLVNDLSRTASRGVMLRLEYNWFNAY
jgi:hypothetical protein